MAAQSEWHVNLRLSVVFGPVAPRTKESSTTSNDSLSWNMHTGRQTAHATALLQAGKFLQFVDGALKADKKVSFFEDEKLNFVWIGANVYITPEEPSVRGRGVVGPIILGMPPFKPKPNTKHPTRRCGACGARRGVDAVQGSGNPSLPRSHSHTHVAVGGGR